MNRRTSSPKRKAETNFPVRLKIKTPDRGHGEDLSVIHAWLRSNLGREDYDYHADGSNLAGNVTAYYLRETAIADRFIVELGLVLADATHFIAPRDHSSPYGKP